MVSKSVRVNEKKSKWNYMRVTDFSACNKKQKNLPQRILCQNWRSE